MLCLVAVSMIRTPLYPNIMIFRIERDRGASTATQLVFDNMSALANSTDDVDVFEHDGQFERMYQVRLQPYQKNFRCTRL